MVPRQYGGTIDITDANRLFKVFLKIKERVCDRFKTILKGDNEAIRYYCGKTDDLTSRGDLGYIFDREALQQIIDKLCAKSADGVIIFNGVRDQMDSEASAGTFNDVDGRPTLMVFPYTYENPANKDLSTLLIMRDEGSEHPGTGGKGKTKMDGKSEYEIPSEFTAEEIFDLV